MENGAVIREGSRITGNRPGRVFGRRTAPEGRIQ